MSHVVELPILTEKWEESKIDTRLNAAKEAYNAILGEYLRRAQLAQDSLAMKKTEKPSRVYQEHGVRFSRNTAQNIRQDVLETGCWIFNHLTANQCDALAERAARAVEDWLYGDRGKPRMKTASKKNPIKSISSANGFDLRDDDTTLRWGTARGGNDALELDLEVSPRARLSLSDRKDHPEITVKRKRIKGEWRYFCDVTCNGHPPYTADPDPNLGERVGVDVGVIQVGVVGPDDCWVFELGDELQMKWDELTRLDRKMDRQKRNENPEKFREDGTAKPRESWESPWTFSEGYKNTRDRRRELYREYEQHRKRVHEKTANAILEVGADVVVETRKYKWAQQLGRGDNIRDNAPARFVDILSYKAESVDGQCTTLSGEARQCFCGENTYESSQWRCDTCDIRVSSPLLTGFLARHYDRGEDSVDTARAREAWDETATRLKESVSADFRNRPS